MEVTPSVVFYEKKVQGKKTEISFIKFRPKGWDIQAKKTLVFKKNHSAEENFGYSTDEIFMTFDNIFLMELGRNFLSRQRILAEGYMHQVNGLVYRSIVQLIFRHIFSYHSLFRYIYGLHTARALNPFMLNFVETFLLKPDFFFEKIIEKSFVLAQTEKQVEEIKRDRENPKKLQFLFHASVYTPIIYLLSHEEEITLEGENGKLIKKIMEKVISEFPQEFPLLHKKPKEKQESKAVIPTHDEVPKLISEGRSNLRLASDPDAPIQQKLCTIPQEAWEKTYELLLLGRMPELAGIPRTKKRIDISAICFLYKLNRPRKIFFHGGFTLEKNVAASFIVWLKSLVPLALALHKEKAFVSLGKFTSGKHHFTFRGYIPFWTSWKDTSVQHAYAFIIDYHDSWRKGKAKKHELHAFCLAKHLIYDTAFRLMVNNGDIRLHTDLKQGHAMNREMTRNYMCATFYKQVAQKRKGRRKWKMMNSSNSAITIPTSRFPLFFYEKATTREATKRIRTHNRSRLPVLVFQVFSRKKSNIVITSRVFMSKNVSWGSLRKTSLGEKRCEHEFISKRSPQALEAYRSFKDLQKRLVARYMYSCSPQVFAELIDEVSFYLPPFYHALFSYNLARSSYAGKHVRMQAAAAMLFYIERIHAQAAGKKQHQWIDALCFQVACAPFITQEKFLLHEQKQIMQAIEKEFALPICSDLHRVYPSLFPKKMVR